jgi:hypothetical protein
MVLRIRDSSAPAGLQLLVGGIKTEHCKLAAKPSTGTGVVYITRLRLTVITFRGRSAFSPAPLRTLVAPIFGEHLRCWPRLTLDRVFDAMRSVPNDVDPFHYVGLSEENILEHVTLTDNDG